jgi:hypothetical protein
MVGAHRHRGVTAEFKSATLDDRMKTPASLRDFHCSDYFGSAWAKSGYYDEPSQIMLVLPVRERVVRADFLVMGRPGVDGIEFGYRRGKHGIWAYYPMEDRFARVAKTTADLIDVYTSSRMKL